LKRNPAAQGDPIAEKPTGDEGATMPTMIDQ
jgi:hypothetical protein